MGFLIVAIVLSALQLTSARDYCAIPSCNGKTHVGCPIPIPPATTACSSFTPINFSATQKALVLSTHNGRRNLVASGAALSVPLTGSLPFLLPKATDMKKLIWDDELELLASYNVRQCQLQHDSCRNTDVYVGQNLYNSRRSGINLDTPEITITNAVNSWYNEINQIDLPQINSFTGANGVGSFTQLIWASTTKVGCAAAKWSDGRWWNNLIACNYAVGGNYLGNKIYTQGSVSASACSATDPIYVNLCV